MNKYQKRKSREIKQIMKEKPFVNGKPTTYKMAKKGWNWMKKFNIFHPCEDCDTYWCKTVGKPIVYCRERR